MTEFKDTFCRLCLKRITDKDFKIIDSVTRDSLDVLLLKLRFNGDNQEVICNSCKRILKMALRFKSMCRNTHNMIMPHVDCQKMLPVDLKEIYIKENGNSHVTGISYNDKICRLCMQPIKGEIRDIGEQEHEAIQKFIPEINIMIIKDPVLCKPCFDSLCTLINFLKECLEVDQRVSDIFDSSTKDKTYDSLSDVIKTEDLKREDFDINEMGMAIETECVDIKSEHEVSDLLLLRSNNETFENCDCKGPESQGLKRMPERKNKSIDKCSTKARKTNSLTLLQLKRSPLYKCDACDYESRYKHRVTKHQLIHKDPSEVHMYRCNDCDYRTKYKCDIKRHVTKHRNPSQMLTFNHDLDPPQVQIYKCNACDYKSCNKKNFRHHQLTHKDPSEVRMYRCNDCKYKTKYRTNIKYHLLKHKDPSQVQMYKCDACDFESRYKDSFIKHQLIHKNSLEVQLYRCNDCEYKTKYKNTLARHLLQHRDASQVQMYKCNACDYESRYKSSVITHQVLH